MGKAWLRHFPFAFVLLHLGAVLQPLGGALGHDHYYGFARLLIGASHVWRNGWSLPHYTPSLCGGLPFLADPQSYFFSLPQFLTLFVDPLDAVVATTLIFYTAGYVGFIRLVGLFTRCPETAALAGLIFATSGFAFEHLFVGHLSHHGYLLLPWVLYLPFRVARDPACSVRRAACALALLLSYLVFSGGFHVLVVATALGLLILPALHLSGHEHGTGRALLRLLGLGAAGTALACCGKIAASMAWSRVFTLRGLDAFPDNGLAFLARYFWFWPGSTPPFIQLDDHAVGIWEFVGFVSKLTVPLMIVAGLRYAKGGRDRRRVVAAIATAGACTFVLLAGLGEPHLHALPFLRSYHNPIKLLGAFAPLMALAAAYALDWLFSRRGGLTPRTRALAHLTVSAFLLFEFSIYVDFFVAHRIGVWFPRPTGVHAALKAQGGITPVATVVDEPRVDIAGLLGGTTSLACYEPVFGYRHEGLLSAVHPGPVRAVDGGAFNMNHPGCLVYPEHFGCKPWDRVPQDQAAALDAFVAGRDPGWGVPPWQSALFAVGFLTMLCLLIGALAPARRPVREPRPTVAR